MDPLLLFALYPIGVVAIALGGTSAVRYRKLAKGEACTGADAFGTFMSKGPGESEDIPGGAVTVLWPLFFGLLVVFLIAYFGVWPVIRAGLHGATYPAVLLARRQRRREQRLAEKRLAEAKAAEFSNQIKARSTGPR